MATHHCRTETEIVDLLTQCSQNTEPVEIVGHGSRRGWGRPVLADHRLDMSECAGITLYEHDELVLSARAGTPMAEIERVLAEHGQELAFEPMDLGPLFGKPAGQGTLGGTLMSNISGPRRIKAGAVRDHVLGIRAVSGWGRLFKSGGRVVKNVTGYDLSRGLAGSWGTLSVVTEATFKVLPKAETATTLAVLDLDDAAAVDLLCAAMGSPWDVSGAAHLPALASLTFPADVPWAGRAATVMRIEGFAPSVAYRVERLSEMLDGSAELAVVDGTASASVWRHIRDALPFAGNDRPLWRVSVAPTSGPVVVAAIGALTPVAHFYDWSGGLIWIEIQDNGDGGAVRDAVARAGGHATLVRGGERYPQIAAFQPQPAPLAALALRLKANLDPNGVLNPGRMA